MIGKRCEPRYTRALRGNPQKMPRRPRLVVIHPPVSLARDFIDYPYFADLGAVQAASVLAQALGAEVDLVDAYALPTSTLAWRPDGRAHLGAPVADVLARAPVEGADAVVVAYTPFHRPPRRDDVLAELLGGLRARTDRPIVLADCYQSGQHYIDAGEQVLSRYPECDAHVKYEAEVTLPALLRAWTDRAVRPAGTVLGESPPSLDDLPFPAWGSIALEEYFRFQNRVMALAGRGVWAFPIDGRTLPIVTSRGCPFACVHCSSNPGRRPGEKKTQRRLSPERMRAHLRELSTTARATRLAVLDELANVSERHFDALLDQVEELDVLFDCPNGLRADYLLPRHLARMRGRVSTVSVSAESGNQRVVTEVVHKRLDLRAIEEAARNAREAEVPLLVHFIIGLPGESAGEINDTLAFAMDLWDRYRARPAVQFATPLPGTALAEGRTLPAVDDWGPAFQTAPAQPDAAVDARTLRRFKWTFDQRLAHSAGPKKVVLNVTYVCNNHCTFCAVGTRTQVHGNTARQREHLERFRSEGVELVDFDGGEPTLHPDLLDLIRHARSIGYSRVSVTTNGRLCAYEDFARRLVHSGLTTLLFSVHGSDAKTHAQAVGVAEAFDQTVRGIENARRHAPRAVELGMNITLTKGNFERLGEVADLAWSLGLPWLNIQFLTPFGRATSWVAPDTGSAAAETRRVIDRWKERMKLQVVNLPFCFLPGYEEFVLGDLAKLERQMIFVNNEQVNLAAYLAERRVYRPECSPCPHRVFCGGFYELDQAPEPPWVVGPADLDRPLAAREPASLGRRSR